MAISRRLFTQAGLSTGALLAVNPSYSALETQLIQRHIPSTGETLPIIGVGTNRYGVGDDQNARNTLKEALKKFHELGGTLIDTAPTYGSSELVLSDLINDLDIQKDLFLASKVDSRNLAANITGYQESLARFNTQQFDLMQVHNFKDWRNSLALLKDKKAAGEIRYIGMTTHMPSQYELMEQAIKQQELDFIQVNLSLANQRTSSEQLIPMAADQGVAVLINRPFGGGGVFSKLGKTSLPSWSVEFDCESWGQFLLKYVLSQPGVTATIPGMTKIKHVVDNIKGGTGMMPSAAMRKRQEVFFDNL
jgi:aryl-alcohol dehydrogenase-like predicted oxidoreductase